MKTLQIQKTRWWAWAAAALLLGAANIAQAGWVNMAGPTTVTGHESWQNIAPAVKFNWSGPSSPPSPQGTPGSIDNPANIGIFTTHLSQSVDGYPSTATGPISFLSYCVDLAAFSTGLNPTPNVLAGWVSGDTSNDVNFNDRNGNKRNLGAAAEVINYASTSVFNPGTLDGFSTTNEKYAAIQIAVWLATYNVDTAQVLSINSLTGFTNNATAITNINAIVAAAFGGNDQAFFVNFPRNPLDARNLNQDQMGIFIPGTEPIPPAVPIPAALFFVAPALLGVLGGIRRKPQGMVA